MSRSSALLFALALEIGLRLVPRLGALLSTSLVIVNANVIVFITVPHIIPV
jgi:hypothetical protein